MTAKTTALRRLRMDECELNDLAVDSFVHVLYHNQTLEELNMKGNAIGDHGAVALG